MSGSRLEKAKSEVPMPSRDRADILSLLQLGLMLHGIGEEALTELERARIAWRYALSRQEVELLELLATGLTNKEIAAQMNFQDDKTITRLNRDLFKKLRVKTRTEAARIALSYGLVRISVLNSDPK